MWMMRPFLGVGLGFVLLGLIEIGMVLLRIMGKVGSVLWIDGL